MKSTVKLLHSQKLHVFFRRVSTENQSLEMQMAADKKYQEILDGDEYVEFNELGVSANKVKMKDREQLMKVIGLIKENRVKTIYVYDRSRLARNFYEYLELVDLFISYGVNVIFTTTDPSYPKFSGNFMLEGFNAILVEEEGKAIARRISDVNRKIPNRKFGYRVEKENDKKSYFLETENEAILRNMFSDAGVITDTEDFIRLIVKYSSSLKKQVPDIIRILSDPFYAAHERLGNRYSRLNYVDALIDLEQFQKIQDNIEPFVKRFQKDVQNRLTENVIVPYCGVCHKKMNYKKDKLGKSGFYSCSSKHQKVSIEVDGYNESIKEIVEKALMNLDSEQLKETIYHSLSDYISLFSANYESLSTQIAKQELEVTLLPINVILSKNNMLASLKKLKNKRKEVEHTLLIIENHKLNVRYLAGKIVEKLNDSLTQEQLLSFSNLLIHKVFVHDSSLTFQLYFSDFIDEERLIKELDGVISA